MSKAPHHRGVGGPKRKDPNRCIRDHDLTVPEHVFVDAIGARHCRLCRAEREARTAELKRTAGVQRKYRFSECVECGKAKYPDRRRMCFTCLHEVAMERPALVEAKLDRAVAAEDLLPWERKPNAILDALPMKASSEPTYTFEAPTKMPPSPS